MQGQLRVLRDDQKAMLFQTNLFLYFVIILCIVTAFILVPNVIYYKQIVDYGEDGGITVKNARLMYGANIFLMIPVFIILIYAVLRIIFGNQTVNAFENKLDQKFDQVKEYALSRPGEFRGGRYVEERGEGGVRRAVRGEGGVRRGSVIPEINGDD